jgi:hypothetical protein
MFSKKMPSKANESRADFLQEAAEGTEESDFPRMARMNADGISKDPQPEQRS